MDVPVQFFVFVVQDSEAKTTVLTGERPLFRKDVVAAGGPFTTHNEADDVKQTVSRTRGKENRMKRLQEEVQARGGDFYQTNVRP